MGTCEVLAAVGAPVRARVASSLAPACVGLATAIVEHITEHAEVSVSVTPTDAGLQRNPEDSAPTLAPAATKTLTGSIT